MTPPPPSLQQLVRQEKALTFAIESKDAGMPVRKIRVKEERGDP